MAESSVCTAIMPYDESRAAAAAASSAPMQEETWDNKNSTTSTTGKRNDYVGLSNQGATCYMNSLLQTLYMTPEFRTGIYAWNYNEEEDVEKENCIPYQLQKLFGILQLSHQSYAETKDLTRSFQWDVRESFQQHDVQEFCRVLFDAIESTCISNESDDFINHLYQGELIDYVRCKECKYVSKHSDKFLDISLNVRSEFEQIFNDSLEKALDNFLHPENLEGDNQYNCEKCNKKVDATKGLLIGKCPCYLTLQLKRFDLDYTTFQRRKIIDRVTFPPVLDMNKHVHEDVDEAAIDAKAVGPAKAEAEGGGAGTGEGKTENNDNNETDMAAVDTSTTPPTTTNQDNPTAAPAPSSEPMGHREANPTARTPTFGHENTSMADVASVNDPLPSSRLADIPHNTDSDHNTGSFGAVNMGPFASHIDNGGESDNDSNKAEMGGGDPNDDQDLSGFAAVTNGPFHHSSLQLDGGLNETDALLGSAPAAAASAAAGTSASGGGPPGLNAHLCSSPASDDAHMTDRDPLGSDDKGENKTLLGGSRPRDDENLESWGWNQGGSGGLGTGGGESSSAAGAPPECSGDKFLDEAYTQKMIKEYKRRGPFVYELFSILIHSGSAWSGHYYAFIKDLSKKRWYRFDDSNVTAVRPYDIEKAFGERQFFAFNQSGTTAYLLVYKQVGGDVDRDSIAFPDNQVVPHYIKKVVDDMEEAIRREEERKEEKKQQVELKVYLRVLAKDKAHWEARLANDLDVLQQPHDPPAALSESPPPLTSDPQGKDDAPCVEPEPEKEGSDQGQGADCAAGGVPIMPIIGPLTEEQAGNGASAGAGGQPRGGGNSISRGFEYLTLSHDGDHDDEQDPLEFTDVSCKLTVKKTDPVQAVFEKIFRRFQLDKEGKNAEDVRLRSIKKSTYGSHSSLYQSDSHTYELLNPTEVDPDTDDTGNPNGIEEDRKTDYVTGNDHDIHHNPEDSNEDDWGNPGPSHKPPAVLVGVPSDADQRREWSDMAGEDTRERREQADVAMADANTSTAAAGGGDGGGGSGDQDTRDAMQVDPPAGGRASSVPPINPLAASHTDGSSASRLLHEAAQQHDTAGRIGLISSTPDAPPSSSRANIANTSSMNALCSPRSGNAKPPLCTTTSSNTAGDDKKGTGTSPFGLPQNKSTGGRKKTDEGRHRVKGDAQFWDAYTKDRGFVWHYDHPEFGLEFREATESGGKGAWPPSSLGRDWEEFYVRVWDRQTHSLEEPFSVIVKHNDTFAAVKKVIEQKKGLPVTSQLLMKKPVKKNWLKDIILADEHVNKGMVGLSPNYLWVERVEVDDIDSLIEQVVSSKEGQQQQSTATSAWSPATNSSSSWGTGGGVGMGGSTSAWGTDTNRAKLVALRWLAQNNISDMIITYRAKGVDYDVSFEQSHRDLLQPGLRTKLKAYPSMNEYNTRFKVAGTATWGQLRMLIAMEFGLPEDNIHLVRFGQLGSSYWHNNKGKEIYTGDLDKCLMDDSEMWSSSTTHIRLAVCEGLTIDENHMRFRLFVLLPPDNHRIQFRPLPATGDANGHPPRTDGSFFAPPGTGVGRPETSHSSSSDALPLSHPHGHPPHSHPHVPSPTLPTRSLQPPTRMQRIEEEDQPEGTPPNESTRHHHSPSPFTDPMSHQHHQHQQQPFNSVIDGASASSSSWGYPAAAAAAAASSTSDTLLPTEPTQPGHVPHKLIPTRSEELCPPVPNLGSIEGGADGGGGAPSSGEGYTRTPSTVCQSEGDESGGGPDVSGMGMADGAAVSSSVTGIPVQGGGMGGGSGGMGPPEGNSNNRRGKRNLRQKKLRDVQAKYGLGRIVQVDFLVLPQDKDRSVSEVKQEVHSHLVVLQANRTKETTSLPPPPQPPRPRGRVGLHYKPNVAEALKHMTRGPPGLGLPVDKKDWQEVDHQNEMLLCRMGKEQKGDGVGRVPLRWPYRPYRPNDRPGTGVSNKALNAEVTEADLLVQLCSPLPPLESKKGFFVLTRFFDWSGWSLTPCHQIYLEVGHRNATGCQVEGIATIAEQVALHWQTPIEHLQFYLYDQRKTTLSGMSRSLYDRYPDRGLVDLVRVKSEDFKDLSTPRSDAAPDQPPEQQQQQPLVDREGDVNMAAASSSSSSAAAAAAGGDGNTNAIDSTCDNDLYENLPPSSTGNSLLYGSCRMTHYTSFNGSFGGGGGGLGGLSSSRGSSSRQSKLYTDDLGYALYDMISPWRASMGDVHTNDDILIKLHDADHDGCEEGLITILVAPKLKAPRPWSSLSEAERRFWCDVAGKDAVESSDGSDGNGLFIGMGGDNDLDQQDTTNDNDNNGDSPTTGLTGLFGNDNDDSGSAWGNNGQRNNFGNRRSGVGGQSLSTTRPSNERGIKIEIKKKQKQMLDTSIINSTTADATGTGNATPSPPPEAPDPAPPPLLNGNPPDHTDQHHHQQPEDETMASISPKKAPTAAAAAVASASGADGSMMCDGETSSGQPAAFPSILTANGGGDTDGQNGVGREDSMKE
ncbi:unnamed protein product [Vitrella brassicaformis CCMP3155]|uniref:USP domain-containing protein n=3 Tax=Vitrella brassicaformis TaxID=1169539 RepID=A0A0G4GQ90_VITBC|nr:unnamed protein product [Vitrella brassicaformis CCMP3155]|eukprot:CEM32577.1 unnamed protein product [Vitrella brassicaformis CCMP3155]